MTINEVAGLLGYSRERTQELIATGLALPNSKTVVKLASTVQGGQDDVTEEQFDEFMGLFEAEEPGRYPPAAVRRELLVEARHRCAICGDSAPLQFHHMLDWAKVKHHDPSHMLAICGTCHDKCSNGDIDYKSQVMYKSKLKEKTASIGPIDEHAATKKASDKKTIAKLFAAFPRPLVTYFLDKCLMDQIHHDILTEVEPAEEFVKSLTFHLYDRELEKLVRAFFTEWFELQENARSLFHDSLHSGVAFRVHWSQEPHDFHEKYESFHRHVVQAHHAFRLLNIYVRDQFPDLDLDELDQAGVASYNEWTTQSKREVAELRASLIKEREEAKRAEAEEEADEEVEPSAELTSDEAATPSSDASEEVNDREPPPAEPTTGPTA